MLRTMELKNKILNPSISSLLALFSLTLPAQVISPKGQEVEITYSARFVVPEDQKDDLAAAASEHSNYLMGVIKAENFVESMGVSFASSEGIGAPKLPPKITALKTRSLNDGRTELFYNYRAKAILHKDALQQILREGSFNVVLPYDYDKVYDKKCTDSHYNSLGDYWYFWDPYRAGCERLLQMPATQNVKVQVKEIRYKNMDEKSGFNKLRGDNGNGKLFQIDLITGFDESEKKSDQGWRIFQVLNRVLERDFGLNLTRKTGTSKSPLYIYEKKTKGALLVRVRHLLVDTAIDSKSAAFAKFFKESVETADVLIYSGHSGLGGNLDIPSLQEKAGEFTFNPKKRQLFYFNSCSSYTYFLEPFRAEKTKSKIDILSNALAAYMDNESAETRALLKILLDESRSPDWIDVLSEMEAANTFGMTYLLNVGGV
jgi:hypothetical protein